MSILNGTNPLINSCVNIFGRLTSEEQALLLEKLTEEIKVTDSSRNKGSTKSAFGAWVSDQSADEMIREIYESRT